MKWLDNDGKRCDKNRIIKLIQRWLYDEIIVERIYLSQKYDFDILRGFKIGLPLIDDFCTIFVVITGIIFFFILTIILIYQMGKELNPIQSADDFKYLIRERILIFSIFLLLNS